MNGARIHASFLSKQLHESDTTDGLSHAFILAPHAFSRDIQGELRDNLYIFRHNCNVCILDVSDSLYLAE